MRAAEIETRGAGSGSRAGSASLGIDAAVARGAFTLAAALEVAPGEIVGVIGPNGSGKSTLLGAVAGTLTLSSGRISLGTRVLSAREPAERGGAAARTVPRSSRRIGYLDQRARLFPHLDAAANIAFGPRSQGAPRAMAARTAHDWLERVGLAGRGAARESELSGGQQQRVAIARTLAASPDALLLDEPFAAVDVASAVELRRLIADEVRRLGVPTVLVTHDPVDLIALADRVVVLEAGRIAQQGSVAEVLAAPTTDFAAEFSGRVLLRGTIGPLHGPDAETGTGSGICALRIQAAPVAEVLGFVFGAGSRTTRGTALECAPGTAAVASFDPAAVRVHPHPSLSPAEPARSPGSPSPASESESRLSVDPGRPVRAHPAPSKSAGSPDPAPATRWDGTVASHVASRTGVRIECVEWPGFWAEVPVSRALDPGLAPGQLVRVELAAEAVTVSAL